MNNELRIREGIEKYLRDSFKKDSVGLISKLFGESAEYLYAISKIETSEYTDYFKSFDLIWVHVNESYLDKSFIPSTQSYGLFAVNEKKSLHLVHTKPENLTVLLRDDLLREENIKEIPAYILAKLFCDSCLHTKKNWHRVIESFNDLSEIANSREGYELAPPVEIEPASISYLVGKRILRFYALESWLFQHNQISEITVEIKDDFIFNLSKRLFFKKIFTNVPLAKY